MRPDRPGARSTPEHRPIEGSLEPEPRRMEELSPQPARSLAAAVAQVAGDRQAQVCQVRADLVRPPRERPQGEERVATDLRDLLVLGDRCSSAGHDGHPLAVAGVAADRCLDAAARRRGGPPHQGQVLLLDAALAELAHEAGLGSIGLGDHDQAAGLLVQPMHDARAADTRDRSERLPAIAGAAEQGVHQRAGPVAGARVHDEASGLVHDQHRVVLVCHPQRDRFRLEGLVRRRRQLHPDRLPAGEAVAGSASLAVHQRAAVADQALRVRAADLRHACHGEVDPAGGRRALDDPVNHRGHPAGSSCRCRLSKKVR